MTDAADAGCGLVDDGGVLIEGERIAETGRFVDLARRRPEARVIGDGSQLVMPGLIDGHSHSHGISRIQAGVFFDYLENMILDWPWRVALPPELACPLTAVRHLRMGFTTIHHTGFDNFGPQALSQARRGLAAYKQTGIRLAYSPAVRNINRFACDEEEFLQSLSPELRALAEPFTDYDSDAIAEQYLELFEALYAEHHSESCRIFMSPSWAHGTGIPLHIHTLQTPHQRAYGLMKHGKSLLAHLDDLGLVDRNVTFGHAIWIDERDIALLAERGASTTHHASCNFHVRNGISPVHALLEAGVNVALGIDDKSINDDDDPFMEMRMIHKIHRVPGFDLENMPPLSARDVLGIATVNGARTLGFEGETGALRPGLFADAILVDLDEMMNDPWVAPGIDIPELIVHRTKGTQVRTVVVGGRVVVEDRRFVDYDVDALFREVRAFCDKGVSETAARDADAITRLIPHHQRWHNAMLKYLDVHEPFYLMNGRR
jgi:cytosine/adenosine deaminase-related metal-dependent hydrolase